MKSLLLAALLLFLLTVLWRLPAAWVLANPTAGLECKSPSGSLWHGSCAELRVGPVTLDDVSWQLHPAALLALRLDADLRSADARAPGSARVSLGVGNRVSVTDLSADAPLDSGFLPLFPAGWSGALHLDLDSVDYAAGTITALHGTVSVQSLQQRSPPLALGSYVLQFADAPRADGIVRGTLRDSGGPLDVNGTLEIRAAGQYELNGTVLARDTADPEFGRSLQYLGAPDAQGRRPFSLAGSF